MESETTIETVDVASEDLINALARKTHQRGVHFAVVGEGQRRMLELTDNALIPDGVSVSVLQLVDINGDDDIVDQIDIPGVASDVTVNIV